MSSKKNIAFLLTKISERGGISRVVSIISDEIYKTNEFNIHIISYQKRDVKGYEWNKNLVYHELRDDQASMKKGLYSASKKMRKLVDNHNIINVVACGNLVGVLGVLSTLLKKTKLIYWSHSSFEGSTKKNKSRMLYEQFTTLFSDLTISLTKTDAHNYKKKTLARKVIHLYNPIDKALMNVQKPCNHESKQIISVGRLTYPKNFELLVDVAKIVLDKHPEYVWHIYGSGEQEAKITKKLTENNLRKKLILMGQSNKLYNLYPQYCMMVMTSRYEGFPMTLIEGMAYGLPLVSFDISTGPNEIIRDNVNGYLIKPLDIDSMAEKICILIEDVDKRKLFSKNHAKYINDFTMQPIINEWKAILS